MKSKEAIGQMIDKVGNELARLPDYDAFGDSNEEAKQESQELLDALQKARDGESYDNQEVKNWVEEKGWSVLSDYE